MEVRCDGQVRVTVFVELRVRRVHRCPLEKAVLVRRRSPTTTMATLSAEQFNVRDRSSRASK